MKYRIGMIGSGSISQSHTYGYDRLNSLYDGIDIEKVVICSRNISAERADKLGWRETETDWRKALSRPDLDIIDISAYDYLHYPIAKAALECGKQVICEKPLADTYEQAMELAKLAHDKGIPATVCANYRYIHAVRCIKHLVRSGALGEIRHVYGSFTMNWGVNVNDGMNWRQDDRFSPGGVLADLGTHLIDMCRYIGLDFTEVCGMNEVYGKQRMCKGIPVSTTASELSVFNARFANHALGLFELSRVSGGGGGMVFELHGTKGNVRWEKKDMNNLKIHIPGVTSNAWQYEILNAGEILPFDYKWNEEFKQADSFTLLFNDFICQNGNAPTLEDGVKCCQIVDAIEQSEKQKRFIKI